MNGTEGLTVYQVGGSVRDTLLGRPVRERDWVVVGASPEEMAARGFHRVGAAFPVFLHPVTREEYALARVERKNGRGYRGFEVDCSPDTTLVEDLSRRDLTVNAMALDGSGRLIDPFGGVADLERRRLRHLAPAFAEDPLRVLRVARFRAELADFGFEIAPETLELMGVLVRSGEVAEMAAERIWSETVKALASPDPEAYFRALDRCGGLDALFPELGALKGKRHDPRYHPEGDAFEHVLMVLTRAAGLTMDPAIRFAALTHDLGKGESPVEMLPHHYGHEERGGRIVTGLCARLKAPHRYARLAVQVALHHMRCHRVMEMRPGRILTLLESLNALRRPDHLDHVLLACAADAGDRVGEGYPAGVLLRLCQQAACSVESAPFLAAGVSGIRLGAVIRQARIARIKEAWSLFVPSSEPGEPPEGSESPGG